MPNMDWADLGRRYTGKLGACAEYFVRIEFLSRGMDVYTPEVDDHGVDLIVRGTLGLWEIQIKSAQYHTGSVFLPEIHFSPKHARLCCALALFQDGRLPDLFLIPASAWAQATPLLQYYPYDKGQKSKPEYVVNFSKKNLPLLDEYAFDKIIPQL